MTTTEFSDQFDIKLNSFVNKAGFGESTSPNNVDCNEYEKSLFLTQAQNQLVLSLLPSFESTEFIREQLQSLVKERTYEGTIPENIEKDKFYPEGVGTQRGRFTTLYYTLPENLISLIYEDVLYKKSEKCTNLIGSVIPVTHDDVWRTAENPFKGPSEKRVLRLNIGTNQVQLIMNHPVESYNIRYIERPTPIILTKLPDGLSIDGKDEITECMLHKSLHQAILDSAVQIAYNTKIIGKITTDQKGTDN